jgi:outer membrane protein OmpA-like peptidoglycan-associated protein
MAGVPEGAAPAVAAAGSGGSGAGERTTEFAELRTLIIGPEQRELRALEARISDPGRVARDVSAVLPEAVLLRKHDPHLTRALAPTIEEAITSSVRKNPQPLADALFPVIGPAIRKAIAASLSGMLETLNRTLEHSVSWRAVQWRLTALRTGRSFAEVVLLNTLVYRVEQVLLIDRRTGLLLQHVTSGSAPAQDADMVSGMLTAIRDFAHDSFHVAESDALETLQVGDVAVWIEQGPYAIVAAVIRGTAPQELRTALQETLEYVHAYHGEALRAFSGDAAPFESLRPALESLLHTQYRRPEKPVSRRVWLGLAIVALAAAVWLVIALQARARWNAYIQALRAEPGIVVVSTGTGGGRRIVNGLRDPLAREPASLLATYQLTPRSVGGTWQLYQALDPELVLRRARVVLRPPAGVTLRLANGVLAADGTATAGWIVESTRIAPAIGGVLHYDPGGAAAGTIADLARQLEEAPVLFVRGSATPAPGSAGILQADVARVRAIDAVGTAAGRRVRLEITGHADSDGPPQSNDPLSLHRAERVRETFAAERLPSVDIVTRAVGSREPVGASVLEADKQRNRRVSFRVLPPAEAPGK